MQRATDERQVTEAYNWDNPIIRNTAYSGQSNRGTGNKMNIVLIGYRCSGKTAVGEILAYELGRDFLDTDTLIEERAGCSIEALIYTKGWVYFRETEKGLVQEVSMKDNLVIATGGGVVMDEGNVKNLKKNSWIVWLNGRPEVLKERMGKEQRSGKSRPSLTGADPLAEIEGILSIRKPLYEQAGDLTVDTSNLSIQEAASVIMKNLPTRP
jgi:shikimate kinase